MNPVPEMSRRRQEKFGAAVGYLTGELSQVRLSKG